MSFSIGIMDSGLGGLSVASEINKLMPKEQIIYFGDSKNAPYSKRSNNEIHILAKKAIKFLLNKKVKLIVVACNTITVAAIAKLRQDFPNVPIIGTVPVIKTAVKLTKNGRIGIFSTKRTSESKYQKDLIEKFAKKVEVLNLGSDKIVPLIEQGKSVKKVLKSQLGPFQKAGIDVVVLGCTHFPLIEDDIKQIMVKEVAVIDSGAAIARQVNKILKANKSLSKKNNGGDIFYTTGSATNMVNIKKKLGLLGKVSSMDLG